MSIRTPSYRLHRASGQAVTTLNGRDVYLGKHGSPQSRAEYDRLMAEWLANGRTLNRRSDVTVNELLLAYIRHVDSYYVKDGKATSEATLIRLALRPLRQLYGHTLAKDFGPLSLVALRQTYIDSGFIRTEVNRRTRHVVRFFRWCVANEHLPASIHHGLKTVEGLRKGRSEAPEGEPVKPVPDAFVDAIKPHVSRQVWTMVELQRLSGMRPGEVVIMRTGDLDVSGPVWCYVPGRHKSEHHDRERTIYLGPGAQRVILPWLKTDLGAYLFSPCEAMEERRAEMRRTRKTAVQPSQRDRSKAKPKRSPGRCYMPNSYRHAIARACAKANIPSWHPHQLRHNAATMLRKEFGLDVARVVLGHASPAVTASYAEIDREKAIRAMEQVG